MAAQMWCEEMCDVLEVQHCLSGVDAELWVEKAPSLPRTNPS